MYLPHSDIFHSQHLTLMIQPPAGTLTNSNSWTRYSVWPDPLLKVAIGRPGTLRGLTTKSLHSHVITWSQRCKTTEIGAKNRQKQSAMARATRKYDFLTSRRRLNNRTRRASIHSGTFKKTLNYHLPLRDARATTRCEPFAGTAPTTFVTMACDDDKLRRYVQNNLKLQRHFAALVWSSDMNFAAAAALATRDWWSAMTINYDRSSGKNVKLSN